MGILQVLGSEFREIMNFEILNFHPCKSVILDCLYVVFFILLVYICYVCTSVWVSVHARIQKVLSVGSNFDIVFYEGRKDPNSTIRGASTARQRNAI